jgi:putative flippase GtrA
MKNLLRQLLRFALVGLANTAVGLGAIYAVMFFLGTGPAVANAIGYAFGLAISFTLNRGWTFGDKGAAAVLLPRFLLVVGIAYLLNLGAVLAVVARFPDAGYLAQVLGVAVYTVCVFAGCRWLVFTATQRDIVEA